VDTNVLEKHARAGHFFVGYFMMLSVSHTTAQQMAGLQKKWGGFGRKQSYPETLFRNLSEGAE
jgi:hypothetical protein